ncbi:UPF0721 transmembrane protein [Ktedonobacter sp. SOSP1-52]|uniref:sulfite exporter TauE/SafE family protein n=1 Tax=Ktedonobacter sp. SOSP1-52 TaxID=2778366 RepID=UPI00191646D2|nr:sulfite exporter TauE/SafE family protein [Ktedonobacter sp. SOSP1-52]GHO66986.1 UPF0721 transmembrane protein [Ktedonobacter sp. SOSP1-52]
MTLTLTTILLIFSGSILAGLMGSLLGLGGGILIVPMLSLAFGLPIQYAVGASVIAIIATSSGSAAAYVRDRLSNIRVGMFLETATVSGAIVGALLATIVAPQLLYIIFGIVLLISLLPILVKLGEELPQNVKNDRLATALSLASSYPDKRLGEEVAYEVTNTGWGFLVMCVAGCLSGLLGIGSGVFKVLAMDTIMRIPMKVSTTTSNFMIGVTGAASASIYFARGDVHPLIAAPVALGILAGSFVGARILPLMKNTTLRKIFIPVLSLIALQMVLHGFGISW